MVKVSIIVPIYNVEKYLKRCIDSLINQSLKDIEIILVDDGSTDNSPSICDTYKNDKRIKIIHKVNNGLGMARNSGIELATGEYIAFVDSDDYIELNAYKELYNKAQDIKADALFFGWYVKNDNNHIKECKEVSKLEIWEGNYIKNFLLDMLSSKAGIKNERKYQMSVWHALYRRDIIEKYKIRFMSERDIVSEDLPFQVDFLQHTHRISYLPKAFYYYCYNKNSLSKNFIIEKFERYITLRNSLMEKGKDSEFLNRVNRLFIGYNRAHIIGLFESNRNDKYKILQNIINHKIWEEIAKQYPPQWLPLLPRIQYRFIIHRNLYFLYIYSYIYSKLKKLL